MIVLNPQMEPRGTLTFKSGKEGSMKERKEEGSTVPWKWRRMELHGRVGGNSIRHHEDKQARAAARAEPAGDFRAIRARDGD